MQLKLASNKISMRFILYYRVFFLPKTKVRLSVNVFFFLKIELLIITGEFDGTDGMKAQEQPLQIVNEFICLFDMILLNKISCF